MDKPHRRRGVIVCGAIAATAILASLFVFFSPVQQEAASSNRAASLAPVDERDAAPDGPDERMRRMFVGTWHTDHEADRTLVVRDDGTATMTVELDGVGAFLLGKKLVIDIEWSISDGRMTQRLLDGTPTAGVKTMVRMFGDTRVYDILDFADTELELRKADADERILWTRLPAGAVAADGASSATR